MKTFLKAALSCALLAGMITTASPVLAGPLGAAVSNAKTNTAAAAPAAKTTTGATVVDKTGGAAIPKSVRDRMTNGTKGGATSSALTTQECQGLGGKVIWNVNCASSGTPFQCVRQGSHDVAFAACITELRPD